MAKRPPSRTKRWADACSAAESALEELVSIQEEFESWKEGIPENLQSGNLYDKLESICGLELQSALDTVQEAGGADLPLGFGRD